jgi:hypothetical protein
MSIVKKAIGKEAMLSDTAFYHVHQIVEYVPLRQF